jgi:hypothetical protein
MAATVGALIPDCSATRKRLNPSLIRLASSVLPTGSGGVEFPATNTHSTAANSCKKDRS